MMLLLPLPLPRWSSLLAPMHACVEACIALKLCSARRWPSKGPTLNRFHVACGSWWRAGECAASSRQVVSAEAEWCQWLCMFVCQLLFVCQLEGHACGCLTAQPQLAGLAHSAVHMPFPRSSVYLPYTIEHQSRTLDVSHSAELQSQAAVDTVTSACRQRPGPPPA